MLCWQILSGKGLCLEIYLIVLTINIMGRKFISWRRVSTGKQAKSGLGLEAQKSIIKYFVDYEKGVLIADYEECHTGTSLSTCTELKKAMEQCKRDNAILIIAKVDRFRTVVEALQILDYMGEGNIMFCDLPTSDRFSLTLYTALAEREALITSIRTKQALAVKKAHGAKLGASNEKYRINYEMKLATIKKEEVMKRGLTKNTRHLESRDVKVFCKIMAQVFPDVCVGDVTEWRKWSAINTQKENRLKILSLMRDYRDIDAELFSGWDLSDIEARSLQQKLSSYIASLHKSADFANGKY